MSKQTAVEKNSLRKPGLLLFGAHKMSKRNKQGGRAAKRTILSWQCFHEKVLEIAANHSDLDAMCKQLDECIAQQTDDISTAISAWRLALTKVQSRAHKPLPTEYRGQTWANLIHGVSNQCGKILKAIDEMPFLLSIPLLTAEDRKKSCSIWTSP